jgi:hypothetical protein
MGPAFDCTNARPPAARSMGSVLYSIRTRQIPSRRRGPDGRPPRKRNASTHQMLTDSALDDGDPRTCHPLDLDSRPRHDKGRRREAVWHGPELRRSRVAARPSPPCPSAFLRSSPNSRSGRSSLSPRRRLAGRRIPESEMCSHQAFRASETRAGPVSAPPRSAPPTPICFVHDDHDRPDVLALLLV